MDDNSVWVGDSLFPMNWSQREEWQWRNFNSSICCAFGKWQSTYLMCWPMAPSVSNTNVVDGISPHSSRRAERGITCHVTVANRYSHPSYNLGVKEGISLSSRQQDSPSYLRFIPHIIVNHARYWYPVILWCLLTCWFDWSMLFHFCTSIQDAPQFRFSIDNLDCHL